VGAADIVIVNEPRAATDKAVPLVGNYIPGSTQQFSMTESSEKSPVFYAPHHGRVEQLTYWGSLAQGTIHALYLAAALSINIPVTAERISLELMRIASLESNWDGEGAEAISQDVVTNASLLLTLASNVVDHSTIIESPVPLLIPSVEGAVILKWAYRGKELKCTVFGDRVEVVRWRSKDRYESDGLWEIPVQLVLEHFEWLIE
jgi:hypothetical protein